jgi:hypothetical protein
MRNETLRGPYVPEVRPKPNSNTGNRGEHPVLIQPRGDLDKVVHVILEKGAGDCQEAQSLKRNKFGKAISLERDIHLGKRVKSLLRSSTS